MTMLREKKAPAGTTPELAAAAKKVIGVMNVGERNALEKAGSDSHFAAALAARIALELARAEATRLLGTQPAPVLDEDSVKAVTDIVDTAAARLQKEVEVAIGRADVDMLQLLTVANAAVSRDLLVFREAGDRIQGVGTAPRAGAVALDPDIVLPGQIPRQVSRTTDRPVMKPELREFDGLGERPARSRKALFFLSVLAGAAAAAYLVLFAYPRISEVRAPILGIARIEVSGKIARVTLSSDFAEHEPRAIAMLTQTLRERGVDRALLVQRNGSVAGQLSVREGKVYGLASSTKQGDAAPGVTPQSSPSAIPAQAASAQPQ
jgi:hypothetical protein